MQSSYEDYIEQLDSELLELPDQEDLDGAALGLIRLQEIYLLPPENITKGTLTGKPSPLNPDEAYHLARVAYEYEKFQHAFLWAYESLKQKKRGVTSEVSFKDVLTVLSSSSYKFGQLPLAVFFTEQLLKLDPTDEQVRYVLKHYKLLKELRGHIPSPNMFTLTDPIVSSYEALCRGEDIKKTPKRQRALYCRYSTGGGNPRLIYAPVKEEEESDNPPIIRYYDVLSEKEIEILKSLSRPKRLCINGNCAALNDEEDPVIGRVNQRIADITGLDMESSELLQVANYGIGGRFEPHYDAKVKFRENFQRKFVLFLSRMATVLIYLSDVEVGGATVFPEVGVALKPQKGSAVLWFNLLRNGRMDDNALHAGCPVFIGNKWIATKWFRERGQEFRRPCSLSESE
ncbi:prolyl 4-hydroxylase subunit alpha-2-like [Chanos chanos]|uniref:procollagen-proline 4-dioxygenase n=1 Tax=Chanos chanos TaxID=29144 RepID=A0A6J2VDG1_CHACN|nr:prolyl 4-hydroxylase subunit alpha-2-like [Chanos chanos]